MAGPIIQVENLGKRYVLNHQTTQGTGGYRKFSDALVHVAKAPFRRFQTKNQEPRTKNQSEDFWALKDVSFEVKQGEVLGIIGRNGAGKSTLLKILSRITEPTTGRITLRGRVASLLEVGTGFHPELTGRENIYLNGAILGMTKAEIRGKFDEIVAFAEVEKFLDTPVKRYSSGMYVRLAFAVAAHLEPEILIIDEVLAVGDAEFQKKCLGKMQDVASHGRTILFVSHNLGAVSSLCSKALVMQNGEIAMAGEVSEGLEHYLTQNHQANPRSVEECRLLSCRDGLREVEFVDIRFGNAQNRIAFGEDLSFNLHLRSRGTEQNLSIGGSIFDVAGSAIATFFTPSCFSIEAGRTIELVVRISHPDLIPGHYSAGFSVGTGGESSRRSDYDIVIGMPNFEIDPVGKTGAVSHWEPSWGRLCWNQRIKLAVDSSVIHSV